MMNQRLTNIDKFIKEYSAYIAQKENKTITEKNVYNHLIHFNLKKSTKNNYALFNKWLKHFKTYKDINVFVDSNYHFYCQFYRNAYLINEESLKIYLPLKEEGYRSSLIISLIDHLNELDINFIAKISSTIRNDTFCLRVNNIEDIDIIINFLDKNKLYKDYLTQSNPFLFNYKNYGICFDGRLNYNLEISLLINKYINHLAKTNDYDNASYEGFKLFVKEVLKALTNNDEFAFDYLEDRLKLSLVVSNKVNLIKMFNQIIISLDNENLDDFIYLYEEQETIEDDFYKKLTILEKATFDTYKIKGLTQTRAAISKYISKNDCQGFTRAKGSRLALFMFTNSQMSRQEIKKEMKNIRTQEAIKEYIQNTKIKAEKIQDDLLQESLLISFKKNGDDWTIKKYLAYLLQGDYSIFTRDQDLRNKISYIFYPQDFIPTMKRYLQKHNYASEYLKTDKIIDLYENLIKRRL